MDQRFIARVKAPAFWPASDAAIAARIARFSPDRVVRYGISAGGRNLHLVRYPNPGLQRFWLIGGTHGHEPGTVAACFNFLSVIHTGKDLRGTPWPEICHLARMLDITVVPCLNPDGRSRCPDSFVGWPTAGMDGMAQSWRHDRSVPALAECIEHGIDPTDVLFLGGRFNDAGILANRPVSETETRSVEFQQLLNYMDASEPPQCYLDLHGCGYNCFIMNGAFSEECRQRVRHIDAATRVAIEARGHQYNNLQGDVATDEQGVIGNIRILYRRYSTLGFIYEGRQGFLDVQPWCDEGQIIDDYLIAICETMRAGVEAGFIP